MKHSKAFKEQVVQKVLTGRKVKEVAEETGITDWTIYQWIKQHGNGGLTGENVGPRGLTLADKQKLVLESQTITEDNKGEWLRKKAIHSEHLNKWQQEIMDAMNKNSMEKKENKKLLEEITLLKKEIERKDKALAEAAVLLTLKKKFIHLWEGEEK